MFLSILRILAQNVFICTNVAGQESNIIINIKQLNKNDLKQSCPNTKGVKPGSH